MRWLRLFALVAVLAPLAACRQGVGERCQVQSDCDDNLLCILPAGGTPQSGGTCQPPGGAPDLSTPTDGSIPDLSTPPDLSEQG